MIKESKKIIYLSVIFIIILFLLISAIFIYNTRLTGKVIAYPEIDQNISFAQMQKVANELESKYISQDYWVKRGSIYYLDIRSSEFLINTMGDAQGLSPASPYGTILVPLNPEDKYTIKNSIIPDQNLTMDFRLRQDEAIIILGLTPPKSKFFSYVPYLYTRDINNQEVLAKAGNKVNDIFQATVLQTDKEKNYTRFKYQGSFDYAPPLNDEVINTSKKSSGNFNAGFVIILTADKQVDKTLRGDITSILQKYNLNKNIINTLKVPADKLNLGYNNDSDTILVTNRVAYVENKTEGEIYFNNTPIVVLRIVPKTQENLSSPKFNFTYMPSKNTSISENYLNNSLALLIEAVKLAENKPTRSLNATVPSTVGKLWIFETCVKLGLACGGDDQDAGYYSSLMMFNLTNTSEDFVIIVGVNHVETKKASYQNFAFYGAKYLMGVGSINQDQFSQSARQYLPYVQKLNASEETKKELIRNIDKFITYKFSRICNNKSYCQTIPYNNFICLNASTGKVYTCGTPDQAGINEDELLWIPERAYDDPFTNNGPSYDQMLAPVYLYYKQN
jgi:hypothetical protein